MSDAQYYRADLFQRFNLTVPQTWDELLSIGLAMNGTDLNGCAVS